jgi:hypothetical protein
MDVNIFERINPIKNDFIVNIFLVPTISNFIFIRISHILIVINPFRYYSF